jgi:hypothetical protein
MSGRASNEDERNAAVAQRAGHSVRLRIHEEVPRGDLATPVLEPDAKAAIARLKGIDLPESAT